MRAIGSVPPSCDILTPPSTLVAFAHACRPASAWRPWREYLPDVEMLAPNRIASGICHLRSGGGRRWLLHPEGDRVAHIVCVPRDGVQRPARRPTSEARSPTGDEVLAHVSHPLRGALKVERFERHAQLVARVGGESSGDLADAIPADLFQRLGQLRLP